MTILQIIKDFFFSSLAAATFAILFNLPKKEFIQTAFAGGLGWSIYIILFKNFGLETFGVFAGALAVAVTSRIFSYSRLNPSTIYLAPALIPLVPGTEMYYIASGFMNSSMTYTFIHIVRAIKFAGDIALAILVIYTIPDKYFKFFLRKS